MLSKVIDAFLCFFYMHLRVGESNSFPPPLSHQEETEYFRRMKNGDASAREKLIEHNLRLVSHIVRKYYTGCPDAEDLVSIGTVGLIKAIDSFNYENGARFATYGAKCLQNEILMYFRSKKKTNGEVSMYEAIDTDKDGNPLTYMDIISVDDTIAEDIFMKSAWKRAEYYIEKRLDKRERQILYMRYGLNDEPPLTQNQVAKRLGISRSYVSRLEKSAICKLKEYLK